MTTTSTGIYVWKLGDIALARVCKKVYAKVQVVKNEDGLFHDEKGITADENGVAVTTELCYYVETVRTKLQMWLPYTCMHLAQRSRPFYGSDARAPVTKPVVKTRKRKIIEDHVLPLNVKLSKYKEPDLNVSLEIRQKPLKQGKYENAFKEFVRQGKEHVFDDFYSIVCFEKNENTDILDYLENVDASTEDKFEMVIKNIVTEKEIENYLHQCWRYNFVQKQMYSIKDGSENMKSSSLLKFKNMNIPVTVHAPWCLVCGGVDKLWECTNCPASFHLACRREWLVNIIHRKSPPKKVQKPVTLVAKILSSTRTITSAQKEKENIELCPSCMWGPKVGYDDVVWHKLGTCSWWPARVLTPGTIPSCLLRRNHSPHQWPLQYYDRKSPPKKVQKPVTLVAKILSSTRTVTSVQKEKENFELCPSCMWGPKVGYDDVVWHKLGTCSWWPARVLTPGTIPSCLLRRNHSPHQWPLQYYGTLNYSWGDSNRICLFLPKHTGALQAKDDMLRQAVLDACDDYIAVYLT